MAGVQYEEAFLPAKEAVWNTAGTSCHPHWGTQAGTACLVSEEEKI